MCALRTEAARIGNPWLHLQGFRFNRALNARRRLQMHRLGADIAFQPPEYQQIGAVHIALHQAVLANDGLPRRLQVALDAAIDLDRVLGEQIALDRAMPGNERIHRLAGNGLVRLRFFVIAEHIAPKKIERSTGCQPYKQV